MLGLAIQNRHRCKLPSDVNFYDGHGFPVYTYTAAEALALQHMPEPPDLDLGEYSSLPEWSTLTKQWNWTLEEMKNAVRTFGYCEIGVTYGNGQPTKTLLAVAHEANASVNLTMTSHNCSSASTSSVSATVTVDWGDGATSTWTKSAGQGERMSNTVSHAYSDGAVMHTISLTRAANNINANIPYVRNYIWSSGMAIIAILLSGGMGFAKNGSTGYNPYFSGINADATSFNAFYVYFTMASPNNSSGAACIHIPRSLSAINVDSKYNYDANYFILTGVLTLPPGIVLSGAITVLSTVTRVIYTGASFTATHTGRSALSTAKGVYFGPGVTAITAPSNGPSTMITASTTVYFYGATPPTLKYVVFDTNWSGTIHCPAGKTATYKAASGYPQNATYIDDL